MQQSRADRSLKFSASIGLCVPPGRVAYCGLKDRKMPGSSPPPRRLLQSHVLVLERQPIYAALWRGDPGCDFAGFEDTVHAAVHEGAVIVRWQPFALAG